MQISETTFQKLPEHLKHLFKKLPNPGSEEVLAAFPDAKTGAVKPYIGKSIAANTVASFCRGLDGAKRNFTQPASDGSAARFFYCAKANKKDRDEGLDGFDAKYCARDNGFSDKLSDSKRPRANTHPTVKPVDLMRYLCRLVTPPGGTVLDPFMGSGSTGKAATLEGFQFIGIERDAEYLEIARARINAVQPNLL